MDGIACGASAPCDAHHIVQGGRRLGHMFVLPFCFQCHRGKFSITYAKKSFIAKYGTEMELLERVNEIF
ncbi:MAG: hypothetical protein ACRC5T_11110 [Cetobacterium sp.]